MRAVPSLFRLGGDDGIDGGTGGLVAAGPDVAVGVERGLGAGMMQARSDGLYVGAGGDEDSRSSAAGRDSGSPRGGPEPSCGLTASPALPPTVRVGGRAGP